MSTRHERPAVYIIESVIFSRKGRTLWGILGPSGSAPSMNGAGETEDCIMSAIHINKENFYEEVIRSEKPVLLDFWAE